MPFFTRVPAFPLIKNFDASNGKLMIGRYKVIKTALISGSFTLSTAILMKEFVADVVKEKIKLRGYTLLVVLACPPAASFCSVIVYAYCKVVAVRRVCKSVTSVVGFICCSEVSLANAMFVSLDYLICGEIVPVCGFTSLDALRNETSQVALGDLFIVVKAAEEFVN